MKQTRKRLGDLLVESGLITEEQLQSVLRRNQLNKNLVMLCCKEDLLPSSN